MFNFLRQQPFAPGEPEELARAQSLSDTRESQWWWHFLCFMADGLGCAVWAAVQSPHYSGAGLGLTLFLGLNAHRRSQQSEGSRENGMLGSLKAEQELMSPPQCEELDVTKKGPNRVAA